MTRDSSDNSGDNSGDLDATISSSSERYCPSCDESFPTTLDRCPSDGTALVELADEVDSLIGLEIDGRFTIKRRLGKGGMGAAYAAVQHSIGREVAIKVIHPHLARDKMGAKRFLRETKIAAQLSHPNTVTVIDFGQADSESIGGRRLYMAMELVEGITLSALLRENKRREPGNNGALAIERAVAIALQLCDALEAAHQLDIVHRDLKPSNIMLEPSPGGERVKVLDFGLAKSLGEGDTSVTESNVIVGTPQYISPELVVGSTADTRADLYSLGAVLYELVAGRPPFVADSVQACLFSQVHDAPPPLPDRVPNALTDIILQLLAKRPELRFQSAAETRAALRCFESSRREQTSAVALAHTLDPSQQVRRADVAAAESATVEKSAEHKGWRGLVLGLGALGLIAAIAAIGWGMTRGESTAASVQPDAGVVSARVVPADAAAATSRDAAAMVTIEIKSQPAGAVATLAYGALPDRVCTTPCSLEAEAASDEATLTFTRRGYRTETRAVSLSEDDAISVKLRPRRKKKPGDKNGDKNDKPPDDGFVDSYKP